MSWGKHRQIQRWVRHCFCQPVKTVQLQMCRAQSCTTVLQTMLPGCTGKWQIKSPSHPSSPCRLSCIVVQGKDGHLATLAILVTEWQNRFNSKDEQLQMAKQQLDETVGSLEASLAAVSALRAEMLQHSEVCTSLLPTWWLRTAPVLSLVWGIIQSDSPTCYHMAR